MAQNCFRGKDARAFSLFLSTFVFMSRVSRLVIPLGGTWVTGVGEGYKALGP